jgi:hypothetical protein
LFSKTLRDSARKEDLVSRWGGEEFLVVLPEAKTTQGCRFVERLREELALRLTQSTTPAFTASFGVSDSLDADRFEELVALADRALLAAKQAGRNRVVAASSLRAEGLADQHPLARSVGESPLPMAGPADPEAEPADPQGSGSNGHGATIAGGDRAPSAPPLAAVETWGACPIGSTDLSRSSRRPSRT